MPDNPLQPVASKTHRLDYAPPLTFTERLARRLPNSEQFIDFLKTLVWVGPLTLLIWVYAEREQSVVGPEMSVSIDVANTDPTRVVTLRGPADKNVVIQLSGPRAKLDQITPLLQPNRDGRAALLIPDNKYDPGPKDIQTLDALNELKIFKENGVTVKSAQPGKLFIDIETFEEKVVPVKAAPEVANLLSEKTRFLPPNVKLRAPKSLIQSQSKELFVYADLANRVELKTRIGKVPLDNIPLYWGVRRENVYINPASISAELDIKPQDMTWTIPSLSVFKESPADFDNDYKVFYDRTINNVEVTGPREQIDLLQKPNNSYKAVIEIGSLDEDKGTRPLKFVLPPGVTLVPDTQAATKAKNWAYTKERRAQ